MDKFILILKHYLIEVIPTLIGGFLISGLINEFVPSKWVEKNLSAKGIKSVFYATLTGTLLPVCCWGSLPIAVSFYQKGASLGPILAFLIATPATSVSALLVTWRLLGIKFALYTFFSVMAMGILIGIIGNRLRFKPVGEKIPVCPHCAEENAENHLCVKKTTGQRIISVLSFAFLKMPKDIGLEILFGLLLAAFVNTFVPIGTWIKNYLFGAWGYLFALIFGLVTYFCATASVPLVDALINQGLAKGAGFVLLVIGPITSYGTILVLRKEFGTKVLLFYLSFISITGLLLGYIFSLI